VFENRVLNEIFGPKRDEVRGECTKLHNEKLHGLYSPHILQAIKSRRMSWMGQVVRMAEGRGLYRLLVGKPEVKRPMGKTRRRWEGNIKMGLEELECGGME
jgi:hypothetical protein